MLGISNLEHSFVLGTTDEKIFFRVPTCAIVFHVSKEIVAFLITPTFPSVMVYNYA
jgi:hypothetical protein